MLFADLVPGAVVATDYHRRITFHTVVERKESGYSQSGVVVRVSSESEKDRIDGWIDAAWFSVLKGAEGGR